MNTRTVLGLVSVAVVVVTAGCVGGLTPVGSPSDEDTNGDTTPTATLTATPAPTATPMLTTVSATTTPAPTPTPEGPGSRAAIEYYIYQRVNFHRASHGYDRIQLNETLQEVARSHSEEMAEEGSLAVKASGDQALDARLDRFDVDCQSSTETVARVPFDTDLDSNDGTTVRYETPKEVASAIVREWMRGQGSKSKILRIEWIDVGIGVHVVEEAEGTMVYATQDLCER